VTKSVDKGEAYGAALVGQSEEHPLHTLVNSERFLAWSNDEKYIKYFQGSCALE